MRFMPYHCLPDCACDDCNIGERIAVRIFIVIAELAIILACMGCAPVKPQVVYIPAQCPAPPSIVRPTLPLETLPEPATPDQVAGACLASIELLKGYAAQCETILTGYKATP